MDPHPFDTLTRSLRTASRRATLRVLLGSVLGGLVPLGTVPAEAKKGGKDREKGGSERTRKRGAAAERCLYVGEKCPKRLKHGKKRKRHTCEASCCTRYAEVGGDGKRRCACLPNGAACSQETARQCCSQVCTGGVCATGGQPASICSATNPCPAGSLCEAGSCQACDVCASGCAFNSVQDALDAASAGATIRICPGTYVSTRSVFAARNVTLIGAGDGADPATNTILQGTSEYAVVAIGQGVEVTLQGLRITGGKSGPGIETDGGIDNAGGILTLIDSTVTGNTAGAGGGIYTGFGSTLTLIDSNVTGNTARADGGGIFIRFGMVRIDAASRVTGNTAGDAGGGIFNSEGTVILASNQIVTNNCPDNCASEPGSAPVTNCAATPVSC